MQRMVQKSALGVGGQRSGEVLPPRRLVAAGRVIAPAVREAIEEIFDVCQQRSLPRSAINELVKRLIPKRLPADISTLPARIETAADLKAALDELLRMRRTGVIDNAEWLELQGGVERQYRLAQEAGG